MAERWQQWMPFHIDRWRGSAHVQAMRGAARAGYLYLLASAWQTDDCSLTADPAELQVMAGLQDDEWAENSAKILRRFTVRADGRLVNEVLFDEWNKAEEKFRTNQARANKTNSARRTNVTRTSGEAPAHALTRTGTLTTPLTPLPGGMRKSEQRKIATASFAMYTGPQMTEEEVEADRAFIEARKKARAPDALTPH